MNTTLAKEEITVSISGDIAKAIQKQYQREDYSVMVENIFRIMLHKPKRSKNSQLALQLRGCAASSGLADKTDREIKEMMYRDKYSI